MVPTSYPVGERASLLAIRTDRFKNELLTVRFAVPVTAATAQRYAVMIELLRRGSERYPQKALFDRRLDDLFASCITAGTRRMGDMQILRFSADFLGAHYVGGGQGLLPQIVEMLGELICHPYLPNGSFHLPYLDSEKRHLRDAIRARINSPRSYARSRCRAALCAGEPYALHLLGEEDTVEALNASDLTALWQALLREVTPTFFYVGNSDPALVAALLEKTFSAQGAITYPCVMQNRLPVSLQCVQEEMPISQGRLVLGYRTDAPFGSALGTASQVLNAILGGSAASKLFLNVRERRSLCYYCSASYDAYKGVLLAESGIKPQNREIAQQAMHEEVAALCRGDITEWELEAAKRALDHTYRQLFDSPAALSDLYSRFSMMQFGESIAQRRAAVNAVTREQVIEAASHLREGVIYFLNGVGEVPE